MRGVVAKSRKDGVVFVTVARKSYPQTEQQPGGTRRLRLKYRMAGSTKNNEATNQLGILTAPSDGTRSIAMTSVP